MSSSFWWNDEDFNNIILVEDPPPDPSLYEVYLDSGDAGLSHDDRDQVSFILFGFLHFLVVFLVFDVCVF
jgi:hypothetical protein